MPVVPLVAKPRPSDFLVSRSNPNGAKNPEREYFTTRCAGGTETQRRKPNVAGFLILEYQNEKSRNPFWSNSKRKRRRFVLLPLGSSFKKPWRLFWPRYFRGRNKRHIFFSSLSLRVSVVGLLLFFLRPVHADVGAVAEAGQILVEM